MPRIQRASINHRMLTWAREQAGLTLDSVARKLRVSHERISSWESGDASPTLRQLRLLGKAYRRPSAFFYLHEPPEPDPEIADYRRTDRAGEGKPPELRYEIRRARSRRDTALEVYSQLGDQPIPFELDFGSQEEPSALGSHVRDFLGVPLNVQFAWENPYEALNAWIRAFESKGILVFQFSGIQVPIARGFSIADRPLPIIALNAKDAPRGRIFTLFHELCHLAASTGGICDLHEEPDEFASLEIFCNAVAAEALVPGGELLIQPEVVSNQEAPEWSNESLRALSNRFMVSQEVVLRRLLTLGRTTTQFYQSKREEFVGQYETLRERRGGFIWYHKKVLRNNGPAYTSLVIDAYREHVITLMDVSRYLGNIRLNHLEQIEHELSH